MHKPVFYDRFEYTKKGELVLITNARGKGLDESRHLKIWCEFDCLKTFESGKQQCRNLYLNNFFGGYYVEYPQEYLRSWNRKENKFVIERRGYDAYSNTRYPVNCQSFPFTDEDAEVIYKKYPDFKYVIKKWKGFHSKRDVLNILMVWKEHKGIELPLSFGYEKVCFNKQFLKLSKDKLKPVAKFMSEHKDADYCWTDIKLMLRYGTEAVEQYKSVKRAFGKSVSMEFAKWAYILMSKYDYAYKFVDLYNTYKNHCEYLGKNMKDPYWKMPSDFMKRYYKVESEHNNVVHMREMEKAKKQLMPYLERVKRFEGVDKRIGRYNIFIPRTIEEWNKQADVLHQCIIRMDYMDKCNENRILVFIYKDGEPCATCEITNVLEKKIGQFYGNEENRATCYPDETTRKVMYDWLDELKVA